MKIPLLFGASLFGGSALSAWKRRTDASCIAYDQSAKVGAKDHFADKAFAPHFRKYKLGEVVNLAEDVAIFRFLLPSVEDEFDLPACSTLQARLHQGVTQIDNVYRFYTPITPNHTKGYFDIIVKKYKGGRMTEHLFGLEVGEDVEFRFVSAKIKYVPNKWKNIGMICGGTGVTSMLQVLRHTFQDPEDVTKSIMLFANRDERKILLKGVLDEIAAKQPDRFKVTYIVDKPQSTDTWKGRVGYIDHQIVRELMPPPTAAGENLILVCGPDGLINKVGGTPLAVMKQWSGGNALQPTMASVNNLGEIGGILGDLGYRKEEVYKF